MRVVAQTHTEAAGQPPVWSFSGAASIGGFFLCLLNWLFIGAAWPSLLSGLLAYTAVVIWMAVRLHQSYPHAILGLCNLVTLLRLAFVGVLFTSLLAAKPVSWAGFALAFIALSLDGVDGWLARKQGLSSEFGAKFDMQVDALLALVLACSAAVTAGTAKAVILLGLPYYLFVIAGYFLPWLKGNLPERFSRKAICVVQIAVLIFLQMPVFANGTLDVLVAAVACALVWSFGRDILWLKRAKV